MAIASEQTETAYYQDYADKDMDALLKSFIQELPDKQRMVLHLRDVEGCDFQEITEIMEIDINAVRMNLSRGRKTIKERLIKTMNYGL
jgi:RNA polymerase sigma-70 factor (ECF subfamily)